MVKKFMGIHVLETLQGVTGEAGYTFQLLRDVISSANIAFGDIIVLMKIDRE